MDTIYKYEVQRQHLATGLWTTAVEAEDPITITEVELEHKFLWWKWKTKKILKIQKSEADLRKAALAQAKNFISENPNLEVRIQQKYFSDYSDNSWKDNYTVWKDGKWT